MLSRVITSAVAAVVVIVVALTPFGYVATHHDVLAVPPERPGWAAQVGDGAVVAW